MSVVTVVVPAYNAERTIAQCLTALLWQDLPRDKYDIIVIDDGSQDVTAEIASRLGARVIGQPNAGAAAARNTGWRAAHSEWIAFTDADCVPARSWLRALVSEGTRQQAIGVAGKTLGLDSRSPAARFCDLVGALDAHHYLSHPKFPFAPSSNLMYRREALEDVGGFDERYASYEACDLHQRITRTHSAPFLYEPRAIVLHRHRDGWSAYWRQQYSYGIGYGQFMMHYRDECHWTAAQELREWRAITSLGLQAWMPRTSDQQLYRRGMFVKRFAQHLGFLRARLDKREWARW